MGLFSFQNELPGKPSSHPPPGSGGLLAQALTERKPPNQNSGYGVMQQQGPRMVGQQPQQQQPMMGVESQQDLIVKQKLMHIIRNTTGPAKQAEMKKLFSEYPNAGKLLQRMTNKASMPRGGQQQQQPLGGGFMQQQQQQYNMNRNLGCGGSVTESPMSTPAEQWNGGGGGPTGRPQPQGMMVPQSRMVSPRAGGGNSLLQPQYAGGQNFSQPQQQQDPSVFMQQRQQQQQQDMWGNGGDQMYDGMMRQSHGGMMMAPGGPQHQQAPPPPPPSYQYRPNMRHPAMPPMYPFQQQQQQQQQGDFSTMGQMGMAARGGYMSPPQQQQNQFQSGRVNQMPQMNGGQGSSPNAGIRGRMVAPNNAGMGFDGGMCPTYGGSHGGGGMGPDYLGPIGSPQQQPQQPIRGRLQQQMLASAAAHSPGNGQVRPGMGSPMRPHLNGGMGNNDVQHFGGNDSNGFVAGGGMNNFQPGNNQNQQQQHLSNPGIDQQAVGSPLQPQQQPQSNFSPQPQSWKLNADSHRKDMVARLHATLSEQGDPSLISMADSVEAEAFEQCETQKDYDMKLVQWLAAFFNHQTRQQQQQNKPTPSPANSEPPPQQESGPEREFNDGQQQPIGSVEAPDSVGGKVENGGGSFEPSLSDKNPILANLLPPKGKSSNPPPPSYSTVLDERLTPNFNGSNSVSSPSGTATGSPPQQQPSSGSASASAGPITSLTPPSSTDSVPSSSPPMTTTASPRAGSDTMSPGSSSATANTMTTSATFPSPTSSSTATPASSNFSVPVSERGGGGGGGSARRTSCPNGSVSANSGSGKTQSSNNSSSSNANPHSVDSGIDAGIGSPRSITSSSLAYSPKIQQGTSPTLSAATPSANSSSSSSGEALSAQSTTPAAPTVTATASEK